MRFFLGRRKSLNDKVMKERLKGYLRHSAIEMSSDNGGYRADRRDRLPEMRNLHRGVGR
jgi:hypothetical protein